METGDVRDQWREIAAGGSQVEVGRLGKGLLT